MRFTVPDMSCGHCKATIERAVKDVDPSAVLEFDLPNRKVDIDSATEPGRLRAAMSDAGYNSEVA